MNAASVTEPRLSPERLLSGVLPRTRERIDYLAVVEVTDSTNAQLLADTRPLVGMNVLFAGSQTAGRGRRGKTWHSPPGAQIYLSVSHEFRLPIARLPALGLAVGVAVAQAVECASGIRVGLKWPNDLMHAGRKLGGILVESVPAGTGITRAVMGIGLNVDMPSKGSDAIDQPFTDVATAMAGTPDINAIAIALLDELADMIEGFSHAGFSAFANAFDAHDVLQAREVAIESGAGRMYARVVGIDAETGALRVQPLDGGAQIAVHSGEVSVRW